MDREGYPINDENNPFAGFRVTHDARPISDENVLTYACLGRILEMCSWTERNKPTGRKGGYDVEVAKARERNEIPPVSALLFSDSARRDLMGIRHQLVHGEWMVDKDGGVSGNDPEKGRFRYTREQIVQIAQDFSMVGEAERFVIKAEHAIEQRWQQTDEAEYAKILAEGVTDSKPMLDWCSRLIEEGFYEIAPSPIAEETVSDLTPSIDRACWQHVRVTRNQPPTPSFFSLSGVAHVRVDVRESSWDFQCLASSESPCGQVGWDEPATGWESSLKLAGEAVMHHLNNVCVRRA